MPHPFRSIALIACAVFGASLAPTAFAENDTIPPSQLEQRFKAADKDHDGKLTRAEADAGMPRVAKNFDRLDQEKKGYLTLDQLKSAMATMADRGGK
jgi:Ca2+-binding EF-hand superfamily protein